MEKIKPTAIKLEKGLPLMMKYTNEQETNKNIMPPINEIVALMLATEEDLIESEINPKALLKYKVAAGKLDADECLEAFVFFMESANTYSSNFQDKIQEMQVKAVTKEV